MYTLNLAEDNRILSAGDVIEGQNYEGVPIVEKLPPAVEAEEESITNYLYIDGEYIHDPEPEPEPTEPEPTQLDILEAQVTYTAMMTDTLLEV